MNLTEQITYLAEKHGEWINNAQYIYENYSTERYCAYLNQKERTLTVSGDEMSWKPRVFTYEELLEEEKNAFKKCSMVTKGFSLNEKEALWFWSVVLTSVERIDLYNPLK